MSQQSPETRRHWGQARDNHKGSSPVAVFAREVLLDRLRGTAVVWMTVFHFSFDLNHFGWIHQDFYRDPVWTLQRTAILSLFLLCAGWGQAIAVAKGQTWGLFWRRWLQVAGCAILVSAGSWLMFPKSWIYFGVLHGMAAMLLVTRLTAAWGAWMWISGALTLSIWSIAPFLHAQYAFMAIFNNAALSWIGLAVSKPVTEDYVPLFPWMAVMWWGYACGTVWLARRVVNSQEVKQPAHLVFDSLTWLGRSSLSWYMLHQPVMLGLLMVVAKL